MIMLLIMSNCILFVTLIIFVIKFCSIKNDTHTDKPLTNRLIEFKSNINKLRKLGVSNDGLTDVYNKVISSFEFIENMMGYVCDGDIPKNEAIDAINKYFKE